MSKILSYYFGNGLFWIRVFGYGIAIKDLTKQRLLFSERNGYTKVYKLGSYSFKVLKRLK